MNLSLPGLQTQIIVHTAQADRALSNFEGKIAGMGRKFSNLGLGLSLGISLPVQLALVAASKAFADLEESAIRTTSRISDATKQTSKDLQNFVVNLSKTIPTAANEIEESIDQITRMGGKLDFGKKMAEPFSKYAKVLNLDVREATDVTTRVMTELGMQTNNVGQDMLALNSIMDRVIQTQEATGWSNRETLEAFQAGSAVASKYGMSLNQLAVSMVMLGKAGKEGSNAGTALNLILSTLERSQALYSKSWASTLHIDPAKWGKMDWMEKFGAFKEGIGKLSPAGQEKYLTSVGIGRRQWAQISPFINQIGAVQTFVDKMNLTNVVQDRFNKLMESSKEQLHLLWNRFVAIGIAVGSIVLPPMIMFLKIITGVINAVMEFSRALTNLPFGLGALIGFIQHTAVFVTLIGLAAAGPLLVVVSLMKHLVGWFISGVGAVIQFTTAFKSLNAVMAAQGVIPTISMLLGKGRAAVARGSGATVSGLKEAGIGGSQLAFYSWLNRATSTKFGQYSLTGERIEGPANLGFFGRMMRGYNRVGGIGGMLDARFTTPRGLAMIEAGRAMAPYVDPLFKHIATGGRSKAFYEQQAASSAMMSAGQAIVDTGFFRRKVSIGQIAGGAKNMFLEASLIFGHGADGFFKSIPGRLKNGWKVLVNFFDKNIDFNLLWMNLRTAVLKGMYLFRDGVMASVRILMDLPNILAKINLTSMANGIASFVTAISKLSLPMWGWLAIAITVVGVSLWELAKKLFNISSKAKEYSDAMIETHPTDIQGRLQLPEESEQFQTNKGPVSAVKYSLVNEHAAWWKPRFLAPSGIQEADISSARKGINDKFAEMAKKFQQNPNDIDGLKAMRDQLTQQISVAHSAHYITDKEQEDRLNRLKNFAESGFTKLPEGFAGDEDFDAKKKHARTTSYFSARLKGSVEEYKERVMGQNALVRVAHTELEVAKKIEHNTKQTAANTAKAGAAGQKKPKAPISK